MAEPKLCPNCPYISFIPHVKNSLVSYTREKTELSNHALCMKLRAFARQRNWKFQVCPYFPENESMETFL